ncbi:hypothetical protein [Flavobacterium phage V157]|nr:hypothetical protein [Flavobacterium phage V175]ASD52779.1 hypothetical protein [Flavobacterium phage V156]ASD52857.1 hypothetical protein [Flavobacterium phage V157]ASD52936.1 hypothetical protein [Flavobacterium phage V165]ASD53015.1 hypothetical protein [Flavobacterium phage V182]QCW20953.1 hypothetical protein [Flavobacterium phage FCOV-F2]QCW21029.1 hypothetical protein [Flavobacterium phage FCOV-F6]QCW21105.1 hypothetical protein [Flavobacterium phage FCOV-F9]QCW21329.1 hypothetica
MKTKYKIFLYRKQTRHRLVKVFRSYYKLASWVDKNIKEGEQRYYYFRKQ